MKPDKLARKPVKSKAKPVDMEVEKLAKKLFENEDVTAWGLWEKCPYECVKDSWRRTARYVRRLLARERKAAMAEALRKIGPLRHPDNIMQILRGMAGKGRKVQNA